MNILFNIYVKHCGQLDNQVSRSFDTGRGLRADWTLFNQNKRDDRLFNTK